MSAADTASLPTGNAERPVAARICGHGARFQPVALAASPGSQIPGPPSPRPGSRRLQIRLPVRLPAALARGRSAVRLIRRPGGPGAGGWAPVRTRPVGRVIDPVIIKAHRRRPPPRRGPALRRTSRPPLSCALLRRPQGPCLLIENGYAVVHVTADGACGPAGNPPDHPRRDARRPGQARRRVTHSDQRPQPPPRPGGIPADGSVAQSGSGDGEQPLRRRRTDPPGNIRGLSQARRAAGGARSSWPLRRPGRSPRGWPRPRLSAITCSRTGTASAHGSQWP